MNQHTSTLWVTVRFDPAFPGGGHLRAVLAIRSMRCFYVNVIKNCTRPPARVIGVDVGGTKTHVRTVGPRGALGAEMVIPSGAWRVGDLFSDPGNFRRLAETLKAACAPLPGSVAVLGMHGCDTGRQIEAASRVMSGLLPGRVVVVNDAQLLGHAMHYSESIQMIVGTGAVICGTTSDGTRITVDGHGWPLGDQGSSSALVSSALRATLAAGDSGKLAEDVLYGVVLDAFAAADAPELAAAALDQAGPAEWGAHAPLIFAAADAGSQAAGAIVDRAGTRLARGVRHLLDRGAAGQVVVAAGGVIVNQPAYEALIRRKIAEFSPGVDLVVLREPPVAGAVALAEALAGPESGAPVQGQHGSPERVS